jgi:hypothetical protein
MAGDWHDSSERPAGSPLSGEVAARVEAIVHAAEREAHAVERAIAERRRAAEEEVRRYLAAARLHADAEAAARAARLESLGGATRRLADELTDAVEALRSELHRSGGDEPSAIPGPPWPAAAARAEREPTAAEPAAPPPPVAEPTWTREPAPQPAPEPEPAAEPEPEVAPRREPAPAPVPAGAEVPSAARLVAIEMAVGGSSRAEVERELRARHGIDDPAELLDDVFGAASHAGSTLAWGEPEPLA